MKKKEKSKSPKEFGVRNWINSPMGVERIIYENPVNIIRRFNLLNNSITLKWANSIN